MPDKEDFEKLKTQILAMPDEKTKRPRIPVEVEAQEAEQLTEWAQDDKDRFQKVNFNWNIVKSLPVRAGAARYAEALWRNLRLRQEDAQRIWETERVKGYDMREELIDAMEYAFDEDDDLIQRLQEIQEGESHADMIQDLTALSALGREKKEMLEAIAYPMNKIEQAAKLGDRLSKLLAEAGADRLEDPEEKKIRDKAYTYLAAAVRKVRRCGKFACRDDESRLKGYTSEYTRRVSRRYRKKQEETAEQAPA